MPGLLVAAAGAMAVLLIAGCGLPARLQSDPWDLMVPEPQANDVLAAAKGAPGAG